MKKLYIMLLIIVIMCNTACGNVSNKESNVNTCVVDKKHQNNVNKNEKLIKKISGSIHSYEEKHHIKPQIVDYPDYSEDAIKLHKEYMELYKDIEEKIKSGFEEENLTVKELDIKEYFERGLSPWNVDPGCGWYCSGYFKEVKATSELKLDGAIKYRAENVNDFYIDTCWCEGVDGYGIGEKVVMITDSMCIPHSLSIYNGYGKSEKVFKNNSRVKELFLKINDAEIGILDLEDTRKAQVFYFDVPFSNEEGKDIIFTMEIVSVYKGDKYEDTCISGIIVADGH